MEGSPRIGARPARRLGRLAAAVLALPLAGCAAAEVPVPFLDAPAATDGQTSAVSPAVVQEPPASAPPADQGAASAARQPASAPVDTRPRTAQPYPTFGAPAVSERPVLDPQAQATMEADLEQLAREREQQMRRNLEQGQP